MMKNTLPFEFKPVAAWPVPVLIVSVPPGNFFHERCVRGRQLQPKPSVAAME